MPSESLEDQGRSKTPEEPLLHELYHENSKQRAHDLAFAQRIYTINTSAAVHAVAANAFKHYPGATAAPLPHVHPRTGVEEAIAARRSVRRFTGAELSHAELARILRFANGLTGHLDRMGDEPAQPIRAAPSGGALYPVELYVVVHRVAELEPGVFHYRVDNHSVELLRPGSFARELGELTSDPATFSGAALTCVLTAVFGRSHFKYGERAYRFTLLEAGHICQNVLLTCTAMGLGAVAVGGFIDEDLHELIDIDGVDEAALYLVPIGHPAPRPAPPDEPPTADDLMRRILDSLGGASTGASAESR